MSDVIANANAVAVGVADVPPGRMPRAASTFRVLLVEDNPGDARLIAELLRGEADRFALTTVARLEHAVDALRRQCFDAILLDLSLPDSSGLRTFETLYAGSLRRTPIIVLTGNTDATVALEAMQLGAHDYLIKSEIDDRLLTRSIRYTIERHRLNERLEQAERVKALGHLAAKVAHEFNNVLMGIQPFTELIARLGAGSDRIVRASAAITDAVRRGRHISTEILRYMNPAVVATQRIDVADWIERHREELEQLVAPAILTCVAAPGLIVAADQAQLAQALIKILCNARDAVTAEEGQIALSASLDVSDAGHRVCIEVQDNGCGMTAEVLQHAFEPLFTTKHTGTGLGLALALQSIQAHGGELTAESVAGVGSTFRILLPLAGA